MKSKNLRIFSISFVLAILLACSFIPAVVPGTQDNGDSGTAIPTPFLAETGGAPNFSASLSSPDIVLLTWEAAAEAVGYEVQIMFDGLNPLTIAFLPQEATSFEHILAPESSLLTYRLETITSSGPGGASSVQIATLAHKSNPLTVQAVFSEDGVVSGVIGPAGGMLETTDGRGVTYTLVIPPAALNTDLEITMTPVSAIEGWPLDGDILGAVRLEPEGWLLNDVATLMISMPGIPSPTLSTVGFAFTGSGEEFHLTSGYADSASIASLGSGSARHASPVRPEDAGAFSLPVTELGTKGLGEASADAAAAMATDNAPTSSTDAADQKSAATEVEMDELTPLLSLAELGDIATSNLMTQIQSAQECYDFKRVVGSFHAWESKVAQLGDNYGADRQILMQEMAEKAVETIEKASVECTEAAKGVVPASVPCAEKLLRDIHSASNPFYTELQHAVIQDPDLKNRMTAADDASEVCAHSYGFNDSVGYRWTSSCIPTLDRPYQVAWVGGAFEGVYRLYPSSSPFSGRVEGQSKLVGSPGVTITTVYNGTYIITPSEEDNRGYPVSMGAALTYQMTITSCSEGYCITSVEDGVHSVPLSVRKERCAIP